MANFLNRLIARSTGAVPLMRPQSVPVFAPAIRTPISGRFEEDVESEVAMPSAEGTREKAVEESLAAFREISPLRTVVPAMWDVSSTQRPSVSTDGETRRAEPLPSGPSECEERTDEVHVEKSKEVKGEINRARTDRVPVRRTENQSELPQADALHFVERGQSPVGTSRSKLGDDRSVVYCPTIVRDQGTTFPRSPHLRATTNPVIERGTGSHGLASPSSSLLVGEQAAYRETKVEVTIGRLEVRINSAETRQERRPRLSTPKPSLEEYLHRRGRGGRP